MALGRSKSLEVPRDAGFKIVDGALEGVGKRKNSQTLARSGRLESFRKWQKLVPVVSQRFQESFERHWDRFGALQLFRIFPGAPGGHWERLGIAGSTNPVVWRLQEALDRQK